MIRKPFIAGNWKMNGTVAEAEARIAGLLPRVGDVDFADVAICVPFTAIDAMVNSARGSAVEVYAQNMHQAESGAYTGEVSAPMLTELEVVNDGDRPVQVGSHFHFAEANEALRFDRTVATGRRLAVAAGTSVRFEPGVPTTVLLVDLGGARVAAGFRGLHGGAVVPGGAS